MKTFSNGGKFHALSVPTEGASICGRAFVKEDSEHGKATMKGFMEGDLCCGRCKIVLKQRGEDRDTEPGSRRRPTKVKRNNHPLEVVSRATGVQVKNGGPVVLEFANAQDAIDAGWDLVTIGIDRMKERA